MFDVSAAVNDWVDGVIKRVQDIANECAREAVKEAKQEIEDELMDTYINAAMKWYNAYPARSYSGRRRGSLFNLMSFDDPDDESIEYVFSGAGFAGSNPNPPTSLFEKVFVKGWHGGAYDGSAMRYRTGPGFVEWGKPAKRTASPLFLFQKGEKELSDEYSKIISEAVQRKLEERLR